MVKSGKYWCCTTSSYSNNLGVSSSFSVVVTYNTFTFDCQITPTYFFWKWNRDKEMCQSARASAALMIYSLSGRRLESNCRREETAPLCYPCSGINVLLTQESMTPIDNSKVCPVSPLSLPCARLVLWPRCKLEEQRHTRLRGQALGVPRPLKQKQIRGLVLYWFDWKLLSVLWQNLRGSTAEPDGPHIQQLQ